MHLRYHPARPADFARFYHTFFPRDRDDESLRSVVKCEWEFLLRHPTTLSMMIEDLDQPPATRWVAYAQAVFVRQAFVERLHAGTAPWVCQHLLGSSRVASPLLGFKEIETAHAQGGLSGVMTHWLVAKCHVDEREAIKVRDYLHRGFALFWRGYNLRELILETTGPDAKREAMCAGLRVLNSYDDFYAREGEPPAHARPCLLHLTRQHVLDGEGWLVNGAFAFGKPRFGFGFSLREQEMLRWALTGADDEELARMLCLSIWVIRKRWQNIYGRVQERAPQLLPCAVDSKERGRGAQKRSVLLRFLDAHPEELYSAPTKPCE